MKSAYSDLMRNVLDRNGFTLTPGQNNTATNPSKNSKTQKLQTNHTEWQIYTLLFSLRDKMKNSTEKNTRRASIEITQTLNTRSKAKSLDGKSEYQLSGSS